MAIKTLSLPILAAGAALAAVTAYAFTQRTRAPRVTPRAPRSLQELHERKLPLPTPVGDAPLHATVPNRGSVPGRLRHEVSSLAGAHSLAPDEDMVGEALVDSGAVEVPVGSAADQEMDEHLSSGKLPTRYSTGASLREPLETRVGSFEYEVPVVSDLDIDFDDSELASAAQPLPTVQISEEPIRVAEAYDAVDPEDVGTEWLLRATEGTTDIAADPVDDITELPADINYAVSEASNNAARSPEDLLESLEEEVHHAVSPLAPDSDIWRALDDFSKSERKDNRAPKDSIARKH